MLLVNQNEFQEELGRRMLCTACSVQFYDLGKADPSCPGCNTQYSKMQKSKTKQFARNTIPEELLNNDFDIEKTEEYEHSSDIGGDN